MSAPLKRLRALSASSDALSDMDLSDSDAASEEDASDSSYFPTLAADLVDYHSSLHGPECDCLARELNDECKRFPIFLGPPLPKTGRF